mmetsp:Transcript_16879/g.20716  ORF Transcript_16879/g.20716 Transcript_16879/m.20716 type:complete len:304 (+) Transcript_16879:1-912(+)
MEDALVIRMKLNSISTDVESEFQRVQIIETKPFGKTLVLDGKTQSALGDEFVYHESLVHAAMLWHDDPKRVYIGGGGELATAREVLRHASVQEVVMVDLDGLVVDVCKEKLPEWNANSTDDPRLTVHIGDARTFLLDKKSGFFDVIILDISDPIEAGPAVHLYTQDFYKLVAKKLNPNGVVVTQSGPAGLFNSKECFTAINHTLRSAFNHVAPFSASIPSFGSDWGFNLAYNETSPDKSNLHLTHPAYIDTIDQAIASRIQKSSLRHYDAQTHACQFNLTKSIRNHLQAEDRVITEENPVFMY